MQVALARQGIAPELSRVGANPERGRHRWTRTCELVDRLPGIWKDGHVPVLPHSHAPCDHRESPATPARSPSTPSEPPWLEVGEKPPPLEPLAHPDFINASPARVRHCKRSRIAHPRSSRTGGVWRLHASTHLSKSRPTFAGSAGMSAHEPFIVVRTEAAGEVTQPCLKRAVQIAELLARLSWRPAPSWELGNRKEPYPRLPVLYHACMYLG
ncbi:hypothetical protein EJ03DRAFT_85830 [Teratosphaeria nubilosa]|uniref:Uncharacterized protein n=1 Tax=Teratosphaeria nubilosa TaxID=161662 RepID=A0A6G1LBB6_9PEZI|nr:hypothetical protein EJ03DRAFT_85830 [Teratosphaeria nubilosa]